MQHPFARINFFNGCQFSKGSTLTQSQEVALCVEQLEQRERPGVHYNWVSNKIRSAAAEAGIPDVTIATPEEEDN